MQTFIPLDHDDQLSLLNKSISENLNVMAIIAIFPPWVLSPHSTWCHRREDEFYATKAWSKVMGGSSSFNDPMREFDGLHLSDSI